MDAETGKTYTIRRNYNCNSRCTIFVARCKSHNLKYVGQTFDQRGFVGRHYGHRQDCQTGGNMDELEVIIIDSVQPGNHALLDQKEEEWIHRLRTREG